MRFPDIFTGRAQHAGWSVIQAATLLEEAKARHCASLLIYAALELRLAIEQLIFTIILVAKGRADRATLRACTRRDGLFRVLDEMAPQYTLKCRFSQVLVVCHPEIPQGAEWDVPALRRHHAALSEFCHARRSIRGMGALPDQWEKQLTLLEEIHEFLVTGLKKDTAVLSFKGATPPVLDLWRKYSRGRISLAEVRKRFTRIKPLLVRRTPRRNPVHDRAPGTARIKSR